MAVTWKPRSSIWLLAVMAARSEPTTSEMIGLVAGCPVSSENCCTFLQTACRRQISFLATVTAAAQDGVKAAERDNPRKEPENGRGGRR